MVLNIIKDKIINMLDDKSSYQNSFHKIKHKKLGSYEAAEYLSFNLFNKIISNYQLPFPSDLKSVLDVKKTTSIT